MLGRLKLLVWIAAWLWAALIFWLVGSENLTQNFDTYWGFIFVAFAPAGLLLLIKWVIGDTFKAE